MKTTKCIFTEQEILHSSQMNTDKFYFQEALAYIKADMPVQLTLNGVTRKYYLNDKGEMMCTPKEKDLMILCLLVHDGLKSGLVKQEYTVFEHPILIGKYIIENNDKLNFSDKELEFIDSTIKTHMGEWTKDYNGNEVLEKPHNKYQKFVHMCDFLSSKKFLNVKFEGNEIVK